eukprot:g7160.t1
MSDLCSLGKDSFSLILRKLTASECGRFACVSRACRELVNDDDAAWKAYFLSEFGDANMKVRNDNAKFKDRFNAKAIARNLWTKAQNWHNNYDLVLAEEVEEELLDELESNLDVSLPLDVKEVYRMHNGQNNRSKVREFDIDTIIKKSRIDISKIPYDPPSKVRGVSIATPIFLDLQTVLKRTIELRDHYNHINRNLNSKKQRKLKKEKQQGGVTDIDLIYSSIVYAEISCGSAKQLLLLNCDTHDVYLWEYPLRLIQIPTKSKYGWFAIWLECLTGFDENENSCQVPLSWYLMWDGNRRIPLLKESCKKVKKLITLSTFTKCGYMIDIFNQLNVPFHLEFLVCEFNKMDILFPEHRGIYRGPPLCSIASKISKPLMCHVFSRFKENVSSCFTASDMSEWLISIWFESVESSKDLVIDRRQYILQQMIAHEQRRRIAHAQRQNNALLKSKQRKRNSIKQSIPKRRNTCRALSQQISRYAK